MVALRLANYWKTLETVNIAVYKVILRYNNFWGSCKIVSLYKNVLNIWTMSIWIRPLGWPIPAVQRDWPSASSCLTDLLLGLLLPVASTAKDGSSPY